MFSFFIPQPSQQESDAAKQARELAKQVGPHVYELTSTRSRFLLAGCGGDGGEGQKNVAERIYQDIKNNPADRPDYLFLLGDNFYDYGIDSPESVAFKTKFFDIYAKLFTEFDIKVIAILGNHDLNLSESSRYTGESKKGRSIGLNQRARTLLPQNTKQTSQEILAMLQGSTVDNTQVNKPITLSHSAMPLFFMPWNFFCIYTQDNKAIFCLDSNKLCEDTLFYLAKQRSEEPLAEPNQLEWLLENYKIAQSAGRDIIILTHHPILHDSHDRHDTNHYLTPNQIESLASKLGTTDKSHSHLLKLIFKYFGLSGAFFNAHNHFMEIFDDSQQTQFTLGGGGGALQKRHTFRGHPAVKCHYDDFGYAILCGNTVTLKPLREPSVTYDIKQHSHVQHASDQSEATLTLTKIILRACDAYFSYLRDLEPAPESVEQNIISKISTSLSVEKQDPGYIYNAGQTLFKAMHIATKYLTKNSLKETEIAIAQTLVGYCQQLNHPSFDELIDVLHEKLRKLELLISQKKESKLYLLFKEHSVLLDDEIRSQLFTKIQTKESESTSSSQILSNI